MKQIMGEELDIKELLQLMLEPIRAELDAIKKSLAEIKNVAPDLLMTRQQMCYMQDDIKKHTSSFDVLFNSLRELQKQIVPKNDIENMQNDINELNNTPSNTKAKIFDYFWKYALVGIGSVIAVKISGLF